MTDACAHRLFQNDPANIACGYEHGDRLVGWGGRRHASMRLRIPQSIMTTPSLSPRSLRNTRRAATAGGWRGSALVARWKSPILRLPQGDARRPRRGQIALVQGS